MGRLRNLSIVVFLIITGAIGLLYYLNIEHKPMNYANNSLNTSTDDDTQTKITKRASEVVNLLKTKNFTKLAEYAHPQKGIRFSPYAYVDNKKDLVFNSGKIKEIQSDTNIYTWGTFDGSGKPIELTFDEYYNLFIYSHDFANAPESSYNRQIGIGNTRSNLSEIYPTGSVIEYNFPGFDNKYDGMDWESLRLVFEKTSDRWYVVGVIHDQWTI